MCEMMKHLMISILLVVLVTIQQGDSYRPTLNQYYRPTLRAFTSSTADAYLISNPQQRIESAGRKIQENIELGVIPYRSIVEQVRDLEMESCEPDFWEDPSKAQFKLAELGRLQAIIRRVNGWKESMDNMQVQLKLLATSSDTSVSGKLVVTKTIHQ